MGEVVAIAVPVILAVWSGAGYLAIKHPDTYRTFGIPIFMACTILATWLVAYSAGMIGGIDAGSDFLKGNSIIESYAVVRREASIPFIWGLLIGAFGVGLFVIGLVGQHIEDQREEEDPNKNKRPKGKKPDSP